MDTRLESIYGPDHVGLTAADISAWGGVATGILSGLTTATRPQQPATSTSTSPAGADLQAAQIAAQIAAMNQNEKKQINWTPWIVGGALLVVGAGALIYMNKNKKKKGKRK